MAKKMNITAFDTLFFRDGRPFTMGDESFGTSIFPPAPSVFRGFLRSLFFSEKDGDISLAGGASDPTLNSKITQFSLCIFNESEFKSQPELLFPLPLDLVVLKDDTSYNCERLKGIPNDLKTSSSKNSQLLITQTNQKIKESQGRHYLPLSDLVRYLSGDVKNMYAFDIWNVIGHENRTGIGRDDATRTASNTGQLYQIQLLRTENKSAEKLGFVIGIEDDDLTELNGISRLGAESKLVSYEENGIDAFRQLDNLNIINSGVIMYLSTSAIFREGWYPQQLFSDYSIKIITAAVGRYQSYGGWDIAKRRPKPMFRAVPAGSVFYLDSDDKTQLAKFVKEFHGKALKHSLSVPNDFDKEGFGIVYFGNL